MLAGRPHEAADNGSPRWMAVGPPSGGCTEPGLQAGSPAARTACRAPHPNARRWSAEARKHLRVGLPDVRRCPVVTGLLRVFTDYTRTSFDGRWTRIVVMERQDVRPRAASMRRLANWSRPTMHLAYTCSSTWTLWPAQAATKVASTPA